MSCKNEKKGIACDFLEATAVAAGAVLTSLAGTKQLLTAVGKKGCEALNVKKASGAAGAYLCAGALLDGDFIPTLAQAIDRSWAKLANAKKQKAEAAEVCEDVCVEECTEETAGECVACDNEAVEIPAEPAEEAVPVVALVDADEDDKDDDKDDDEGENETLAGLSLAGLEFIDAKEEPDAYAALLAREAAGEVQLVTRYRRSFTSRLVQSQGDVQAYYSAIKNKLLSYKGVKGRTSWSNESFNKGRTYIAKVNAKAKTLYLYLALDPAAVEAIEDGKYNVTDMSAKKKYANVPTLIKVKGPRKFKYAMELIEMLCAEQEQLPLAKNFEEIDYVTPYKTTEELVEEGSIKKMVAAVPVPTVENEATDGDVTAV